MESPNCCPYNLKFQSQMFGFKTLLFLSYIYKRVGSNQGFEIYLSIVIFWVLFLFKRVLTTLPRKLDSHFCRNVDFLIKMWVSTFTYMKKVIFYINWQFLPHSPYRLTNGDKTKTKNTCLSFILHWIFPIL